MTLAGRETISLLHHAWNGCETLETTSPNPLIPRTARQRRFDQGLRRVGLTEAKWRPILMPGMPTTPVRQTGLARDPETRCASLPRRPCEASPGAWQQRP